MKGLSLLVFTFFILSVAATAEEFLLAGTQNGLYQLTPASVKHIWDTVQVKKILKGGNRWFFLTANGVAASENLQHFDYVNANLPVKVLKNIDNGTKSFEYKTQMLKDLEMHPAKPQILVTATNSEVFFTEDGGQHWHSIGAHTQVNGIKAVCILDLPDEHGTMQLTVFVSHAIYGCAWKQPNVSPKWHMLNKGLQEGPESDEEIADIAIRTYEDKQELYVAQTFTGKLYSLDWTHKRFQEITEWTESLANAHCVDGLVVSATSIIGTRDGGLFEVPLMPSFQHSNNLKEIELQLKRISQKPLAAWVPASMNKSGRALNLAELWLLDDGNKNLYTDYMHKASNRKGVYMPAHHAKTEAGIQKYIDLLTQNNLDTLVIDMKDDFGFIRYDSEEPLLNEVGAVRPFIKLENFTAKTKAHNIYLVARIVAFKDKQLYRYRKHAYAIKNKDNTPWQGYTTAGESTEPIEEYWVDPYNEKVWEYNIAIAEELVRRGFDEIQFDYIRFPTDGENLGAARYPAHEQGMDKESALMSFLAYARKKIAAPISIDIYGANGWYRTGARTGQEVELLADYVDIICPMFYPSHFRQSFLAYPPAKERPYRIYYWGSFRNKLIARNKLIIRPWAQAFYIPVSYDKKFYNEDYVQRQILGIKDSIDEGYVYWNNSGRYQDIRPDGAAPPQ